MSYTGIARRTDLYLRSEYPSLSTTIYKLTNGSYHILCNGFDDDFQELSQRFNDEIKPMTAPVTVCQTAPLSFLEIVPPISDKQISKGFEGIGLTITMLRNLIIAKFQHINFTRIDQEMGLIIVYTAKYTEKIPNGIVHHFTSLSDKKQLSDFLEGLKMPVKFEIREDEVDELPDLSKYSGHNPVHEIDATKIAKKHAFDFSRRDEALWFDKIDSIFEGTFTKKDLYFYDNNEYSCYVDYSTYSNIDLRNHLLLFQVVYLTLPYDKNIQGWLKLSNIKKSEFLDLIAKGRVKLVLTQPEFRYDHTFLPEAYAANPSAVISRRAIAALHQIDLVEMSDNYILNDADILQELKPFCEMASKITGTEANYFYEWLVWPIKARRKSFDYLLSGGAFHTGAYGVNNTVEKRLSDAVKRDLSFDFIINAPAIHLANSLNATYFPFHSESGYSDQSFANVMGDQLNFYKSATSRNIAAFMENKEQIKSGVIPINPIDVIHVNDFITISELEATLSKGNFFPGNKNLIETLAPLTSEERTAKIRYYNDEVVQNLNSNKVSPVAIELGTNLLVDVAGVASGLPFLGVAYNLLKLGGKGLEKATNLSEKLEQAYYDNPDKSNIHYLTKINRVARLKDI